MKSLDLTAQKVIAARDIDAARSSGATEICVRDGCVLTPSARELLERHNLTLRKNGAARQSSEIAVTASSHASAASGRTANDIFHSPEAEAIKAEIIAVGRKLWHRHYVDGNGGNISFRIGPNEVICTPTLISKADLRPEDLCLVDLDGNQIIGSRPRTSEILLHLEIFKAVPQARAAVHCHPPHATAYAITGRVPPTCIIPEYEVFVGSVAISPYETPGTKKFAETVLPWIRNHNTVLLANHGIICWADTVTHAEWCAEIVETYCHTLLIASQLGAPLTRIPPEKESDLLAIKKRLGLPDARFDECRLADLPEPTGAIALPPPPPPASACTIDASSDVESMVQAVTDAVMAALDRRGA
jgi:L-fuculose-phosphate aldolase